MYHPTRSPSIKEGVRLSALWVHPNEENEVTYEETLKGRGYYLWWFGKTVNMSELDLRHIP